MTNDWEDLTTRAEQYASGKIPLAEFRNILAQWAMATDESDIDLLVGAITRAWNGDTE
jgi:hypothetical protein